MINTFGSHQNSKTLRSHKKESYESKDQETFQNIFCYQKKYFAVTNLLFDFINYLNIILQRLPTIHFFPSQKTIQQTQKNHILFFI